MAMNMDAILNLRANVQGANKIVELNRGLMAMEGTAKGVTGAMRGMTGAAAGLSGALGALTPLMSVAGLVGLAKGALDAGDKMHDLAQSTGVSVESLAKFKKAAATSGTDIDSVAKALIKLSKTMLEASVGSKQQEGAFKALGINVKDSSGQLKSADAVMLEVADRFKQMPDGVAKTALSLKLFGRAGAEMIPLLDMGGAAIDKLSVKMTTAFADKADAYKDKLAMLSGKVGALGADLLILLLPALDKITDAVSGAVSAFNGLSEPIKNFAMSSAALAIVWGPLTSVIRGAVGVFALLTTAETSAGAAAAASVPGYTAASGAMSGAAIAGSRLVAVLSRLAAIGIVTVGVNYISNVVGAATSLRDLQDRDKRGGAAADFAGATRQQVLEAQAKQRINLANLQKQDEQRRRNLASNPFSSVAALFGAAPFMTAEQQSIGYKAKYAQAVLGLDPNKFRNATTSGGGFNPDLSALQSGAGGGSKAPKERESKLADILAANGLYRAEETIKARIAKAEFDQNTAEKLRLEYIDRGVKLLGEAEAIQRDKIPQDEKEAKLLGIKDKFIASENQYRREMAVFQRDAIESLPSYLSGIESAAAGFSKTLDYSQRLTLEQEKQKQLADGIAQTIGGGMASAFDALVAGTENFGTSLRKIAAGVLKDIAKQLLQIYVINTAISAISGLFGPKAGGFAPGVKFNPTAFSMPSLLNANGNVFAANGIVPYAMGGIVDRPTLFPFAKGIGLMGEAGPEAILPLQRGANGKLGVAGGGGTTNVVINVDAKGTKTQGDQGNAGALARDLAAVVDQRLIYHKRPGGLLSA